MVATGAFRKASLTTVTNLSFFKCSQFCLIEVPTVEINGLSPTNFIKPKFLAYLVKNLLF